MRTAQSWFDEYGISHKNPINKGIHWICVPAIFFSIVGLFTAIPSTVISSFLPENYAPYFNFASLLMLFVLVFYWQISKRLFFGMLLFSALVIWLNIQLESLEILPLWLLSTLIFVVAWVGQFIGHYIEGAKPSFFKDLQFLLIGPAWLMGFVYKKFGWTY